jgi:hypothetical protein
VRHSLWTFQVMGVEPFAIQPPGNPTAFFEGGTGVFHFMLTAEQAAFVAHAIKAQGLKVKSWPVAGQTEEQRAERLAFLGEGKTEDDFPSLMCPMCFWFDPTAKGMCGRSAWPPESVVASLDVHEAARKGEADCPVRDWSDHGSTPQAR